MIDDSILDSILPVPDLDELKDATVAELQDEGFVITNYHSGGIFYTILMILFRLKIEMTELLRSVLNHMYVTHAGDTWLDLKAADYSKLRKTAQKAQGYVTVSREAAGDAIKIPAGHVFKTEKDINGEELRYFALMETVLQKDALTVDVLVEGETEGSRYNVPQGQITRTLTYLGDIQISNAAGWITQEGSDTEDDDALRARTLRSWSELAQRPIADTYINAAESVNGVLFAQVDDQLPRGQGTLDVIVTGTAGEATESLLEAVRVEIDKIIGPCDNVLVKSSVTVTQDVAVAVTVSSSVSTDGMEEQITAILTSLLSVRKDRELNTLTHAEIIHVLMDKITDIRNVKVTLPAEDVSLETDKVILLGDVTITIQRG
ncbi:MAG: baseplate J/gp47 family protein [Oscillospiraceae bacterium]|nr:baseplate J/gp47 family protein [Oscillospiraceae bacterium]